MIQRELKVVVDGIAEVKEGDVLVNYNLYVLEGDNARLEFITKNNKYKKNDIITLTIQDFQFRRSLEMKIIGIKWKKNKKQDDYFLYNLLDLERERFKLKLKISVVTDFDSIPQWNVLDNLYINITRYQKRLDETVDKKKNGESK